MKRILIAATACVLFLLGAGQAAAAEAESPAIKLASKGMTITVLEPDEATEFPVDVRPVRVVIDDQPVNGYLQGDSEEFCLLYGMNENGDKYVYRYDLVEKTLQRYVPDVTKAQRLYEEEARRYDRLSEDYDELHRLFVALALVSVLR